MYLFDTDHVVIIQRRSPGLSDAISARAAEFPVLDFYISIVTFHEQVAGWQAHLNRKREPKHVVHAYAELSILLGDYLDVQVAEFDQAAVDKFEELRKNRIRIGTMDLRIASIALTRNFTVLTRNLVDFEKVPGLKVEDWTVAVTDKPR